MDVPAVVTRAPKMKRGRLLGVVRGYSNQRVIQCQRLQPSLSWRLDSEDDAPPASGTPYKVKKCCAVCAVR